MTFLTPLIAAIAAGIAIPSLVILYFLKLRRRELEVSTTLLWKKAIQDLQANAPFQKLRRNILLILQLLVLGAALFAVAQPRLKGQEYQNSRSIIMIDRSASMSAIDGDGPTPDSPDDAAAKTRFEIAKKQAKEMVDGLPEAGVFGSGSSGEAMIVAFDTTAEVRQQFTGDKAALKAAIDAIQATDAPTVMGEAMRLAKAHAPKRALVADPVSGEKMSVEGLDAGIPVTIHIFSDGKVSDLNDVKPGLNDEVVFHRIGQPESGNLGIVSLRWERSYDDPTKLSVFVSVQSTFDQPRAVDIELSVDGQVAGIKTLELPAASVQQAPSAESDEPGAVPMTIRHVTPSASGVVFQFERAEGGIAQVRLRATNLDRAPAGDALPTDNRSWVVIPPAKKLAVAAVTRGNLFLAAALEGLPLARLDTLTPEEFQQRARDGKAGEYDVVILDGWLPARATAAPTAPSPTPAPATPPAAGEPAAPATAAPPSLPSVPALPPGRYLILGVIPPEMGIVNRGLAATTPGADGQPASGGSEAVFIDWMRDHPILRSLTLDPVIIAEMRAVELQRGAGAVAIAQTSRGVGLVDTASSDGQWRAIVVPFDIAKSNWPFDVSFVVFMASAVDYLGGSARTTPGTSETGLLPQGMVQPGTVLSDRLPPGAEAARVRMPTAAASAGGRTEEPLTIAADGRVVFGPVRLSGIYDVSWTGLTAPADKTVDGRAVRSFAANLMDSAESDVGSSDELALASKVVRADSSAKAIAERKLWPWFLLGALGIVLLEWYIYNRKVHV